MSKLNIKNVWTITSKDLGLFVKKKSILYTAFALPFIFSIGLPTIIWYVINNKNPPIQTLFPLFDAFGLFFIILAAIIPSFIASYSFVGEKKEKSLEPLLATPTTDSEILLGKSLAAFLPTLCILFISATIFMFLMDFFTADKVGYLYFPNWEFAIKILLIAPLAAIMTVELSIIISSRVNDVRTAQQLSILAIIPFFAIYILTETKIFTLATNTLLIIAGIVAVIVVCLFFLSRAVFQREEILTKWK